VVVGEGQVGGDVHGEHVVVRVLDSFLVALLFHDTLRSDVTAVKLEFESVALGEVVLEARIKPRD